MMSEMEIYELLKTPPNPVSLGECRCQLQSLINMQRLNNETPQGKRVYPGTELLHELADRLLLGCINDPEVTRLFQALEKWYS